mgnify:FL=1
MATQPHTAVLPESQPRLSRSEPFLPQSQNLGSRRPAPRTAAAEPPHEQRIRRRPPGWARVLLALTAFGAAVLLSSLAYLIPPVREGLASDDPLVAMMTTISIWPFLLSFYLLFALLLTRYVDHRPLRAAGLTLNRRAVLSLLTGTGIAVGILCCIKAVFLILGAGEFVNPLKGDPTAMPLWLMIVYALGLCYVSQAIGEEAVMRGYLLQSFSDRPKRAVWISVVVFTIPHLISRGHQQGVADHLLYLALPFGFAVTAAYLSLTMRSVWAGIGIHGGFHLCNFFIQVNPSTPPPVMWVVTGLAFSAVGLLIASRISQERWAEIAARGPFAPPADDT